MLQGVLPPLVLLWAALPGGPVEEAPRAPADGCVAVLCRGRALASTKWGTGWRLFSVVLVGGAGLWGWPHKWCCVHPLASVGRWRDSCNEGGIPGPGLSEVWGQELQSWAYALPVLGTGVPAPRL